MKRFGVGAMLIRLAVVALGVTAVLRWTGAELGYCHLAQSDRARTAHDEHQGSGDAPSCPGGPCRHFCPGCCPSPILLRTGAEAALAPAGRIARALPIQVATAARQASPLRLQPPALAPPSA